MVRTARWLAITLFLAHAVAARASPCAAIGAGLDSGRRDRSCRCDGADSGVFTSSGVPSGNR